MTSPAPSGASPPLPPIDRFSDGLDIDVQIPVSECGGLRTAG